MYNVLINIKHFRGIIMSAESMEQYEKFISETLSGAELEYKDKIDVIISLLKMKNISPLEPFKKACEAPVIVEVFYNSEGVESDENEFVYFVKKMKIDMKKAGVKGEESLNLVISYLLENNYDYSEQEIFDFMYELQKKYKLDLKKPYIKNINHNIYMGNIINGGNSFYPEPKSGMNILELALSMGKFQLANLLKREFDLEIKDKNIKKSIFNAYLKSHFEKLFPKDNSMNKNVYMGDKYFHDTISMLLSLDVNFNSPYVFCLDENTLRNKIYNQDNFNLLQSFKSIIKENRDTIYENIPSSQIKNILFTIKELKGKQVFDKIIDIGKSSFPERLKVEFVELERNELENYFNDESAKINTEPKKVRL